MDYLKVHCFHCKGKFELYSRDMDYEEKPPMCPHCLARMDKTQWERLINAYYTFCEVNKDFRKYHQDRGESLFQVELRNHYVEPGRIVLDDGSRRQTDAGKSREDILKDMETLADIVRHPVPNRNIEDYE